MRVTAYSDKDKNMHHRKLCQRKKKAETGILIFFLGLAALVMALAPSLMDAVSEIWQVRRIEGYNSTVDMDDEETEEIRKEAERYNEKIYHTQQKHIFEYRGDQASDPAYEALLNAGDGTMCTIDIPKIGVYLPVGHGTEEKVLKNSAGHMYGTSLPVGGKSSNAVIAGHTGLSNAKIFTDLDKLQNGDTFDIHIFGEIHEYTVEDIEIVLPDDETPYLQVVPGEDLVTLYTCTPYGVNDHRLIIRGVRSGTRKEDSDGEGSVIHTRNLWALMKTAGLLMLPAGYCLGFWIYRQHRSGQVKNFRYSKQRITRQEIARRKINRRL
ncbi:MAG: class C sortase [Eubacterium sp.]|nr:class C sortase [Eubacterium sp.]